MVKVAISSVPGVRQKVGNFADFVEVRMSRHVSRGFPHCDAVVCLHQELHACQRRVKAMNRRSFAIQLWLANHKRLIRLGCIPLIRQHFGFAHLHKPGDADRLLFSGRGSPELEMLGFTQHGGALQTWVRCTAAAGASRQPIAGNV